MIYLLDHPLNKYLWLSVIVPVLGTINKMNMTWFALGQPTVFREGTRLVTAEFFTKCYEITVEQAMRETSQSSLNGAKSWRALFAMRSKRGKVYSRDSRKQHISPQKHVQGSGRGSIKL